MDLLTIDYETFYDKGYSLSSMTTEEYIRGEFYETIMVSVQRNDELPEWFSGPEKDTAQWLRKWDWDNSAAIAHNAMFDMAILNWKHGLRPKMIIDTLSMLRAVDGPDAGNSLAKAAERHGLGVKGTEVVNALGKGRLDFNRAELERYAEYCMNDVGLTYGLFNTLLPRLSSTEMHLIDRTIRMFSEPVLRLNREVLTTHLSKVKEKKEQLLSKTLVDKSEIMSNPKLADLLRACGVTPPVKISPTTNKETYAFAKSDEEFKALLEHPHPIVQAIVAARLGVKSTLEETRTERLIGIADRGALPIPLRYYAAHTGRWGGCLVDDSAVTVYNLEHGVQVKRIVDVLLDDLVWDGEEFVPHEGVVFSGYSEVIEWDGVKGTEDHVVFTDAGEMSLRDAMQGAHRITAPRGPDQDAMDAAERLARQYEAEGRL